MQFIGDFGFTTFSPNDARDVRKIVKNGIRSETCMRAICKLIPKGYTIFQRYKRICLMYRIFTAVKTSWYSAVAVMIITYEYDGERGDWKTTTVFWICYFTIIIIVRASVESDIWRWGDLFRKIASTEKNGRCLLFESIIKCVLRRIYASRHR